MAIAPKPRLSLRTSSSISGGGRDHAPDQEWEATSRKAQSWPPMHEGGDFRDKPWTSIHSELRSRASKTSVSIANAEHPGELAWRTPTLNWQNRRLPCGGPSRTWCSSCLRASCSWMCSWHWPWRLPPTPSCRRERKAGRSSPCWTVVSFPRPPAATYGVGAVGGWDRLACAFDTISRPCKEGLELPGLVLSFKNFMLKEKEFFMRDKMAKYNMRFTGTFGYTEVSQAMWHLDQYCSISNCSLLPILASFCNLTG